MMQDNRYQNMGFGSNSQSEARWDAQIQWYELKPGVWNQIRVIGPIFIVAQNWFTTLKGKKFPLFSIAWDSFTRSYDHQADDPIYQIFGNPYDSLDEKIKGIAPRQTAFAQAIIRPTAGLANGGELKPMRIPTSVVNGIRKAMELNFITNPDGSPIIGEDGKPVIGDPTDQVYGIDILIHYDPSKQGSEKYSVQSGGRSPLKENEKAMYSSLIDWANIVKKPTPNQVKEALSKNGYMSLSNNTFGQVSDIGGATATPPQMPMQAPAPMAPQMQAPMAPPAPMPMQAPMAPPAPMPMAPPMQAPAPMQAPPAPMAPPVILDPK